MLQIRVLIGFSANPLKKNLERVLGKPCLIGLHLHFYRHISLLAYSEAAIKTARPFSFPLISSWWPPQRVHRKKKYLSLVAVYMTLQSGQLHFIPLYYSSLVVPKYQFRLPPHWQRFSSVFHQHRPTLHAKAVTENIKYDQSPEWSLKKLHSNPVSSPSSTTCLISFFIYLQFTYSSSSSLACLLISQAALNPALCCSLGRLVPLPFSGIKEIRLDREIPLVCSTHLQ